MHIPIPPSHCIIALQSKILFGLLSSIDTQSEESLIKTYDKNNIFILPSFTEGHPQVLDEALARLRPVIVFDEIEHVKRDREGVFICKRNIQELNSIIEYILKNPMESLWVENPPVAIVVIECEALSNIDIPNSQ